MSGCRAGAVLDGPALCGNPVISDAEASALGLEPKWCATHAEMLARVKSELSGRKFDTAIAPKPQPAPAKPPRKARAEVATDLIALVRERGGHVKISDALTASGVSRRTLARIIAETDALASDKRGAVMLRPLGERVADYVNTADTHPIQRSRLVEAFPDDPAAEVAAAAREAVEHGWIVSVTTAGPRASGYFPAGERADAA